MSDGAQREITLGEYVDKLPESHRARVEYMRLFRENRRLREERTHVIEALGLHQDIADGHDLMLAAREIHTAWQAAVEENGRLADDLAYARGALRHAIDATRVELGDPPHAEPWPTWLAQWAAAYAGSHKTGCNCARCLPDEPPPGYGA